MLPRKPSAASLGPDDLHACRRRLHACCSFCWTVVSRENVRVGRRMCQDVHATAMSDQKRTYRKTRRAELEEQTRTRITESAVALHEELGPARTSISAVAERAGVRALDRVPPLPRRRGAVRRLLRRTGAPRTRRPTRGRGPRSRSRRSARAAALRELYAFYGRTEGMYTSLLRDEPLVPILQRRLADFYGYLRAIQDGLMAGRGLRGRAARRTRAAIGHALAFPTWRSLTREHGLSDERRRRADVRARGGCGVPAHPDLVEQRPPQRVVLEVAGPLGQQDVLAAVGERDGRRELGEASLDAVPALRRLGRVARLRRTIGERVEPPVADARVVGRIRSTREQGRDEVRRGEDVGEPGDRAGIRTWTRAVEPVEVARRRRRTRARPACSPDRAGRTPGSG